MMPSVESTEFPEITGYTMQKEIISDSPHSIRLWFYNVSEGGAALINVYVWLINAGFCGANFQFSDKFPSIKSYKIQDESHNDKPVKKLNIEFERGNLSFAYEKIFCVKSSSPTGWKPQNS